MGGFSLLQTKLKYSNNKRAHLVESLPNKLLNISAVTVNTVYIYMHAGEETSLKISHAELGLMLALQNYKADSITNGCPKYQS